MVLSKFLRKMSYSGIWTEPRFGKHYLGWWLVGKPMVDFVFVLIELFFRYLLRFRSYEAINMCSSAVFAGTYLHSNFTRTGSSPINYSWRQKTRHWATIPECDGQTDGRTDRRICRSVPYTALAKLALRTAECCKN